MIARSLTMAHVGKAAAGRRVRFMNDHPNLMKPRPTDKFIFKKNGLISEFVHEKTAPVVERPRRLKFGKRRTLAQMAADFPADDSPPPQILESCSKEWSPRSIAVTTERITPEQILRNKTPACPAYTPMTAFSNGKKMWEQIELAALNRACSAYYELIYQRSELVNGLNETTPGKSDPEKVEQIARVTQKMMQLKSQMNQLRRNIQSIGAF